MTTRSCSPCPAISTSGPFPYRHPPNPCRPSTCRTTQRSGGEQRRRPAMRRFLHRLPRAMASAPITGTLVSRRQPQRRRAKRLRSSTCSASVNSSSARGRLGSLSGPSLPRNCLCALPRATRCHCPPHLSRKQCLCLRLLLQRPFQSLLLLRLPLHPRLCRLPSLPRRSLTLHLSTCLWRLVGRVPRGTCTVRRCTMSWRRRKRSSRPNAAKIVPAIARL